MDTSELIQLIESAFGGVDRPQLSLRQYRLVDQKGLSGEINDLEWEEAGRARNGVWP